MSEPTKVESPTIEPACAISKRGRPRLYHTPEEAKAAIRAQQKMYRERRRIMKQTVKEDVVKLDELPKTEAEAQLNVTIEYFRTIGRKLRDLCRDIDDYVTRADQDHSHTKKTD